MSFWVDDLDVFFADFGINATYGLSTIKVLFHNEYEAAALFNQEIESRNPYVEVKDSDVTGITHASTLVINSTTYHVKEVKPDGTGITVLVLSKD